MKLPVNLKNIITADTIPDGRFRMRITKATIFPKDKEMGERGEVIGEVNDKGNQKYGWLNLALRFVEHPSNYVPGPDGQIQGLVGQTRFDSVSFAMFRQLNDLYAAVGVDTDAELEALEDQEVDVVYKSKPRYDNPDVMEVALKGFKRPVG